MNANDRHDIQGNRIDGVILPKVQGTGRQKDNDASPLGSSTLPSPSHKKLTVADLCTLVVVDYTVNKKRSLSSVQNSIRHLLKTYNGHPASVELDSNVHIVRRQSEGAKNASINRDLSVLKRAFSLAKRKRLIFESPYIETLSEDNVREGFAEVDEYEKVLSKLNDTFKRIYVFGYHKGWRTSEVINIRREWVDINSGFISLERRASKNKKARIVALEPEVLEVVRKAYAISEKYRSPYLFTHRNGRHISRSTLYRVMKRAFIEAGYPERVFHDLRRTAYRHVLRATGNEKAAMNTTGHRSRSIADRYNIVSIDDMVDAAAKVSEYLKNKTRECESRPTMRHQFQIAVQNASRDDESGLENHTEKSSDKPSLLAKFKNFFNRGSK